MNEELNVLRKNIDAIDLEIKRLLIERAEAVLQIGQIKKCEKLPICDADREKRVLDNVTHGLIGKQKEYVYNVFDEIIKNSKNLQK